MPILRDSVHPASCRVLSDGPDGRFVLQQLLHGTEQRSQVDTPRRMVMGIGCTHGTAGPTGQRTCCICAVVMS